MAIRDYLEIKLQGALVAAANHSDSSTISLKAKGFGGTADFHEDPSRGGGDG